MPKGAKEMSWKKELMKGLVELKGEVARQQGIIATQDLTIQRQQKVIERLLDRIQAPSFRELKVGTSEPVFDAKGIAEFYNPPGGDEDLVGMAVPMEEGPTGGKVEQE